MPKTKQFQVFQIEKKSVDVDKASLDAIFSTSDEDRHGDVVVQNWDLRAFKKNPVILNSHNYDDAVEVIGRATNVKVVDGKLEGKIIFAVNENPKAKVIFDLYAGGFLNAFSVGFIPQEFDKDYKILKSELLEVSAVSVPANARALAKAKGIDIDALETKGKGKNGQRNNENTENEEDDEQGATGDSNGSEATGASSGDSDSTDTGKKDDGSDTEQHEESGPGEDNGSTDSTGTDKTKQDENLEPQFRSAPVTPERRVANVLGKLASEQTAKEVSRKQLLNNVLQVIEKLGKGTKVETRNLSDRAIEKRIINLAIRKLIKEKLK